MLTRLVHDGILQRASGRLRVSPRFLAQAERNATLPYLQALEHALREHGYHGEIRTAARYLAEFLADRDQWGLVRPPFQRPV